MYLFWGFKAILYINYIDNFRGYIDYYTNAVLSQNIPKYQMKFFQSAYIQWLSSLVKFLA